MARAGFDEQGEEVWIDGCECNWSFNGVFDGAFPECPYHWEPRATSATDVLPAFEVGMLVRVTRSAWAGNTGRISKVSPSGREVRVSLTENGKARMIDFVFDEVELVSDRPSDAPAPKLTGDDFMAMASSFLKDSGCEVDIFPDDLEVVTTQLAVRFKRAYEAGRSTDYATPRYPTKRDEDARDEFYLKCHKGCDRIFIVTYADRKEDSTGRAFYVCPCGVEKTMRLGTSPKRGDDHG